MQQAFERKIRAHIGYIGPDESLVGEEFLDFVAHAGGYHLHAQCELHDVGLLRDVTIAMDRDWRPLDGFCRLTRGGQTEALFWFDVGETQVDVHGRVAGQPYAERIPTEGRLPYLGLHPLQGDALISQVRGKSDLGAFHAIAGLTNSVSPDGDKHEGVTAVSIDVAYFGDDLLTVAAGEFVASRYALRWHPDWPPADLWVRAEDGLFLKMEWSFTDRRYELLAVEEKIFTGAQAQGMNVEGVWNHG